ncbi:hypothetical protein BKI52_42505 [marine bacterium AO1-C]|nr:hypothetical protein BKI52_42505 [marine bacterium AO1-C]
MQYLKDLQDGEINQLLTLGEDLKAQLQDFERQEIVTKASFVEGLRAILQSHLHQTRLVLPIELRPRSVAETFYALENLIKTYIAVEQATMATLPMRAEMILNDQYSYKALVDDLVEANALAIAERKNILPKTREEGESKYTLEQINEVLHQSNEYAGVGSFANALEAIEQLERMIADFDKYHILVIDRPTIQNNKAFAFFRLNRLNEALHCIDKLLANYEDFALGHHTRAEILDALVRYEEAIESMDQAIALENTPDKVAFRESLLKKISG